MAKTQEAPAAPTSPAKTVKARVLRDCVYGKCDDVVEIDASLIESLHGVVDANPAAVSYAESLCKQ